MRIIKLCFFLLSCVLVNGQILINEGCNKNATAVQDENGDAPDWIELYNNSSSVINLENWKLSDQLNGVNAWVFPNVNLSTQSFLRIFCSGKDRFASMPFIATNNTTNLILLQAGTHIHFHKILFGMSTRISS